MAPWRGKAGAWRSERRVTRGRRRSMLRAHMRRLGWMCVLAASGCSAQGGATPSDAGFVEPADAPTACQPAVDGGSCVLGAQGTVTDTAGKPLGNLVMTFCGAACFGTRSDDA